MIIIKPLCWLGDSLDRVREFAPEARARIGFDAQDFQAGHRSCDDALSPADPRDQESTLMKARAKTQRGSGNVFRDLGFSQPEAENLLLRAQLMSEIREAARGMTQSEAAKQFGVTQPRVNDLLRGKIDKFSLDALVNMLAKAGLRVELRIRKAA